VDRRRLADWFESFVEIDDAEHLVWHRKPLSVIALYIFIGFLVYWEIFIPPPGEAVAALAVAAAAMSIRGDMRGKEKVAWMILFFAFLSLELTSIRTERKANEGVQAQVRWQEGEHFRGIGHDISEGLTNVVKQSNRQFKETAEQQSKQFTATMGGVGDAIKAQTGGDSFCYYGFTGISDSGVQLIAISEGKYALHGVGARIVDTVHWNANLADISGSEYTHNIGNVGMMLGGVKTSTAGPTIYIPFKTPGIKQDLNVFFSGINGMWTQLLRFRKVDGRWSAASIVYGALDVKRFPRGAILSRSVPKDFPAEELHSKDWEGVEKLPKAH
jgi:hypothetical protein